jgi:hypothetical protein
MLDHGGHLYSKDHPCDKQGVDHVYHSRILEVVLFGHNHILVVAFFGHNRALVVALAYRSLGKELSCLVLGHILEGAVAYSKGLHSLFGRIAHIDLSRLEGDWWERKKVECKAVDQCYESFDEVNSMD